jgi:hypothetical protein
MAVRMGFGRALRMVIPSVIISLDFDKLCFLVLANMCRETRKKGLGRMAKVTNGALLQITYWAVGRVPDTSQVAILLNDSPFLMSVEDARQLATALNGEALALGILIPDQDRSLDELCVGL